MKPRARIYRPTKTAMQSGRAKTLRWVLEIAPNDPLFTEPLMGWTGSKSTLRQLKLNFSTKEEAIRYAETNRLSWEVTEPQAGAFIPKSYADNFRFDKKKTN